MRRFNGTSLHFTRALLWLSATATATLSDSSAQQPAAGAARTQARTNAKPSAKAADVIEQERKELLERARIAIRPFVLAELQFIRNACEPSEEQCKQIARESVPHVYALLGPSLLKATRGKLGPFSTSNAHMREIQKAMHAIAREHLRPEQWTKLADEDEKRGKHRRRFAISSTVDQLNRKLLLSQTQRQQIQECLSSHWASAQDAAVLYPGTACPKVPGELISPFLTATQNAIWKSWSATTSREPSAGQPIQAFVIEVDSIVNGTRVDDEREVDRALEIAAKASVAG